MNKRILLNILVSIAFLSFLFYKVEIADVLKVFSSINFYILLFFPLLAFMFLLRAFKWKYLLDSVNVKIPILRSLWIILIGLFYGMFTPGKVGEVGRVYYSNSKKSKVLPTVLWDKLSDIILLLSLSLVVIALFFRNSIFYLLSLAVALAIIISFFFLYNKKILLKVSKMFKIDDSEREDYIRNMNAIFHNKKNLFMHFFVGLLYYLCNFIAAIIILKAIKPDANFMIAFSLPLIILFGNAPITISGLGLREAISAFFFQYFGESYALGVSFSLIWFVLMTLIPGIIGYFISISWKNTMK